MECEGGAVEWCGRIAEWEVLEYGTARLELTGDPDRSLLLSRGLMFRDHLTDRW
jgi:hypothetical protein